MSKHEYRPSLRLLLAFMDMNSLNPLRDHFLIKILNICAIFSFVFYLIWYVIGFRNSWVDINSISEAKLLPAAIVALLKCFAVVYYKKNLRFALLLLKDFWKPERFPNHEKQLLRIHRNAYLTIIVYFVMVNVLSFPAMLSEIFEDGPNKLPIRIYPICDLQTSPCYELLYAYLLIFAYYQFIPTHLYFEGLFVVTNAYIYVGMEMVKISLIQVDFECLTQKEAVKKLSEISAQHELILRFLKEIRHVFTVPLLIFFLSTGATQVVACYMMTADGMPPDLKHIIQYGSVVIIFATQMLYYCISAAIVNDQMQSVADALYSVNWYSKTYGEVRKNLSFMIQRSLKDESFTVGHMIKLNLETFVMVFKNVFSFYTLLSETSKKMH